MPVIIKKLQRIFTKMQFIKNKRVNPNANYTYIYIYIIVYNNIIITKKANTSKIYAL